MEETFPVLNRSSGTTTNITCFLDDTVETIQYRIGDATGIHPDRLRILVKIEIDGDYYAKDSRKWENVYLRMSPEGKIITSKSLNTYASIREPPYFFSDTEYDKTGWMMLNPRSETSFTELRIFGVPEERSWIFPLKNEAPEFLPPPTKAVLEIKGLFKTLHPQKVVGFEVIPHTEMTPQLELIYYPRLRTGSPVNVPAEVVRSVNRQTELLRTLFDISIPSPDSSAIVQARWKLPLVDTDFGNAIRNRFEQIFYGTTLSRDIPVVSFFGGRQEQSRHKFHTENSNDKTPYLDLKIWNHWWTQSKPSKSRPCLVFLRGTSRNVYDRIVITSIDITLSSFRSSENRDSLTDMRNAIREFLLSLDGISAYLNSADYEDDRWMLEDASAILHFSRELKEADFRRYDCLRSIYDLSDPEKLTFKLLRSDQADTGLTDEEIRVIQLLKENEYTTPDDIHEQLPYKSVQECTVLLQSVRQKLDDNSDLLDRQYVNIPTFRMTAKQVALTHGRDIPRITKYISILRDVLLRPDNSDLDGVCPKRVEGVEAEVAVVPSASVAQAPSASSDEDSYLDDLLGEVSEIAVERAPETAPAPTTTEKKARKIKAKGVTSLASYLIDQLHDFDPQTFDPDDPQILRKCDKPRQPVILKKAELERFQDDLEAFNPSADGLEVKDPDGLVVCPEFWCTIDRIPLRKEQLVEGKCPVCEGKVRSSDKTVEKTQSVTEYPVLQRDPAFVYPGYVKYKSKKNDRQIPCCFSTPQKTRVSLKTPDVSPAPSSEMFYILGEFKTGLEELRIGYIPSNVAKLFGISTKYDEFVDATNRLQTGKGGFFRGGVGHASSSLPRVLDISAEVKRPLQNPDIVLRCSFFRNWKGADVEHELEGYPPEISRKIASIDKAFQEKQLGRFEELEYSCLAMNCMCYTIYTDNDSIRSGCFMSFGSVRNVKRAIFVLVDGSGSPDYIVHVSKTSAVPIVRGNLYNPLFPPNVVKVLEELRLKSCIRDVPTIEKALAFILKSRLKNSVPDMKVIIDPYFRAQALFLPNQVLIPFRPTSQIPVFLENRISYSEIPESEYPPKPIMMEYLQIAKDLHRGYEYAHDVGNTRGNVTELMTRSGLRIPVQTADTTENQEEILETVHEGTEQVLTFGAPDKDTKTLSRSITYEAEIFEFLLFQLSQDLVGDDYPTLKTVLSQVHPNVDELKEPLQQWMDTTIRFSDAESPPEFYSKMRQSCTKKSSAESCTGLCVWDGASCRVQVKKVRSTLQRDALEKRLLSTLASNDKIRTIIFENRMSPFFSSILYLELPDEVILSDGDVQAILK